MSNKGFSANQDIRENSSLPESTPNTLYSGNTARDNASQFNGPNVIYACSHYNSEERQGLSKEPPQKRSLFRRKRVLLILVLIFTVVIILVPTLAVILTRGTKDGKATR